MVNGNWTCKNAEAYLKVNGLNDAVVCAVIENASNVVIFREAEKKQKEDEDSFLLWSDEKKNNPEAFER